MFLPVNNTLPRIENTIKQLIQTYGQSEFDFKNNMEFLNIYANQRNYVGDQNINVKECLLKLDQMGKIIFTEIVGPNTRFRIKIKDFNYFEVNQHMINIKGPIDIDARLQTEIEIMCSGYANLYELENLIRATLAKIFKKEYGENWEEEIKKKNQNIVNKIYSDDIQKAKKECNIDNAYGFLTLLDFYDYRVIILNDQNIFKKYFKLNLDIIAKNLEEIYISFRINIAHCRFIYKNMDSLIHKVQIIRNYFKDAYSIADK